MARKSRESRIVRRSAADVPAASATDLARLRDAMGGRIDTSDIPERRGPSPRLGRDPDGRLPRRGMIREAIARELERRDMTPYRLWKEAKVHCPTLSQPAVYEFLKGKRQLELPYAEALIAAVHLGIVRRAAGPGKASGSAKRKAGTGTR